MTLTLPQPYPVNCRKTGLLLAVIASALVMGGCATSKDELLPHNGRTMQELWQQGSSSGLAGPSSGDLGHRGLQKERGELRRPISDGEMVAEMTHYTRDAANEIYSQFSRLPNPDLVMFIYPHLAGTEEVPVPAYSTIFPLYSKRQYAMPGEGARPVGRTR